MNNINDILNLFKPYDYNNGKFINRDVYVLFVDSKHVTLNNHGLFETIDVAIDHVKMQIEYEWLEGRLKHYKNIDKLISLTFSLITFRLINPKLEYESDIQHKIWSHWMKYMYGQCVETDNGLVIPIDKVNRWKKQMNTDYYDLTEKEKQADRDIVNSFINGK